MPHRPNFGRRPPGRLQTIRAAVLAASAVLPAPALLSAQTAPGGPGELPTWTDAGKEGIGTALSDRSKVW
ncbi:MAG TPA: hypothetical protein VJ957_09830, partial [Longimicrobiales bacterium]|nr:hypothetical protein [Longimicrobiales bacterium]